MPAEVKQMRGRARGQALDPKNATPPSQEEYRLNVETWFRGIALMLVVAALILYPLYALIFKMPGSTLSEVVAPVTGIAGAVVGYWFGQASRRIRNQPPDGNNSDGSNGGPDGGELVSGTPESKLGSEAQTQRSAVRRQRTA
jgi:hypothetical protein